MQRRSSTGNEICVDARIEGGKSSRVLHRKRKEEMAGQVFGRGQLRVETAICQ